MDQPGDEPVSRGVAQERRGSAARTRNARWIVGVAVVLAWAAGIALLARREWLKPEAQRLVEAALRVQPSVDYYVLERDGRIVGGASAEVDTTGYGIVARQHLFGELIGGDSTEFNLRMRSSYSPRLEFGSARFELDPEGGEPVMLSVQRTGDSLLTVALEGLAAGDGGVPMTERILAPDPVFVPGTATIPLVLLHRPRRGVEANVRVFDPVSRRVRTIPLRLAADSVFVVVDSATLNPSRERWIMARRDTVRAWLVTSDSTPASVWVDRAGRVVEASDGRGTRATRTTYEIAFENWRLERARRATRPE